MISVDTLKYEASHGHKPRQPYGQPASTWAFTVDGHHDQVVWIRGKYSEALKQAKKQAQYSVTVLP